MDKMKREHFLYEVKRTLICVAAAFVYATGVNLFIVPAGLYSGGVMGFSQVIRTLLTRFGGLDFGGFDVAGLIYYMINIPLFIIAFTRLGKTFFFKTLVTVTAMTTFLSVVPVTMIVEDRMAACVVGGLAGGLLACSRWSSRRLIAGLAVGIVCCLLILAVGLLMSEALALGGQALVELAGCLCGGALAGVLSGGRKKKRSAARKK